VCTLGSGKALILMVSLKIRPDAGISPTSRTSAPVLVGVQGQKKSSENKKGKNEPKKNLNQNSTCVFLAHQQRDFFLDFFVRMRSTWALHRP
jgi:hypothetical protein